MANVEKKKAKLQERITQLENELKDSLQKKAAGPAISVVDYRNKINALRADLVKMK